MAEQLSLHHVLGSEVEASSLLKWPMHFLGLFSYTLLRILSFVLGVSSLLLCGSQESNSNLQAWWQVSLSAKLFCWP